MAVSARVFFENVRDVLNFSVLGSEVSGRHGLSDLSLPSLSHRGARERSRSMVFVVIPLPMGMRFSLSSLLPSDLPHASLVRSSKNLASSGW